MSTCPNCGSEYADGASCVVCGHAPDDGPETSAATDVDDTTAVVDEEATDASATTEADPVDADPLPSWPDDPVEVEPDEHPVADPVVDTPADVGAVTEQAVPAGVGAATAGGDVGRTDAARPQPGPSGQAPPPPALPPAGAGRPPQPAPPSPDALPVTESERNWGMVAHLSSLVAAGVGGMGFLGPLIVWLVKKDDSRFVRHHAVEALNFNLSLLLYTVLVVIVGLTIVGLVVAIPAAIVGLVLWFVTSIVAAVKAQRGEGYRYPLTIRLVRE